MPVKKKTEVVIVGYELDDDQVDKMLDFTFRMFERLLENPRHLGRVMALGLKATSLGEELQKAGRA